MNVRRREDAFAIAACELGLAIAIFGVGLFDGPFWMAGLATCAMLAYWTWTRRAILNRLRGAAWASQTSLAIAVIIAIMGGSYWVGLGVGGHL